jgi:hypothetical protein
MEEVLKNFLRQYWRKLRRCEINLQAALDAKLDPTVVKTLA